MTSGRILNCDNSGMDVEHVESTGLGDDNSVKKVDVVTLRGLSKGVLKKWGGGEKSPSTNNEQRGGT